MTEEITRVFAKPFDMSAADIESGKFVSPEGGGGCSFVVHSCRYEQF